MEPIGSAANLPHGSRRLLRTVHCALQTRAPAPETKDREVANVRQRRPVDAGDVVDVGPTPVMRALIGLAVGIAVGALLALLLPRGRLRRR